MSARPVIPQSLEPIAVWDVELMPGYGFTRDREELAAWVREHLGDPALVCRAAFYVLDRPFAVVTRYRRALESAIEPPVVVPLAELPPEHLLATPGQG